MEGHLMNIFLAVIGLITLYLQHNFKKEKLQTTQRIENGINILLGTVGMKDTFGDNYESKLDNINKEVTKLVDRSPSISNWIELEKNIFFSREEFKNRFLNSNIDFDKVKTTKYISVFSFSLDYKEAVGNLRIKFKNYPVELILALKNTHKNSWYRVPLNYQKEEKESFIYLNELHLGTCELSVFSNEKIDFDVSEVQFYWIGQYLFSSKK